MTLSCKRYLKQDDRDYIVLMSYRIQQKIVRVFHQTMVYISHLVTLRTKHSEIAVLIVTQLSVIGGRNCSTP